jgi:RNA polymerase sigma-70 factor (ECF subfamily)
MESTEKPDEDLVVAALDGDVDSFVTLCHRYYPPLVAIARVVTSDGHLAEDAAQEALAKACRRLDSLKNPKRFGAWLATICRNEARDILRRRPNIESLGERDVPADVPDLEPDSEVDAVREVLKSMPSETRELLYLRYRNELSYEAIANLLDISAEAVHGRLRRAKLEVRNHLARSRSRRSS